MEGCRVGSEAGVREAQVVDWLVASGVVGSADVVAGCSSYAWAGRAVVMMVALMVGWLIVLWVSYLAAEMVGLKVVPWVAIWAARLMAWLGAWYH